MEHIPHEQITDTGLKIFSGPLDIAALAEIDPLEFSLTSLAHRIKELKDCLTKEASFIGTLAHLIYLKARLLIPEQEEPSVECEKKPIALETAEYGLFKQAAITFALKEQEQCFCFSRGLEQAPYKIDKEAYIPLGIEEFSKLFAALWQRQEEKTLLITEEEWKVFDVLAIIEQQLEVGDLSFDEIFPASYAKPRLIATFLAVLELLKSQKAEFIQKTASKQWILQKKHGPF
jgi:chromatin segregation and condensation protein Rec8/ScpA/Scc1 (kleisin family)